MTKTKERILKAIDDKLGKDVTVIEFDDSTVADAFVIATGNSPSHTQAMADEIEKVMAEQGQEPLGREGYREANWILLDYGDTIAHLFLPDDRTYYDLEKLWQDQKVQKI